MGTSMCVMFLTHSVATGYLQLVTLPVRMTTLNTNRNLAKMMCNIVGLCVVIYTDVLFLKKL